MSHSPSILYIAGYGRSGSTILDVLLGAHPAAFGAGELTHAFRAALTNEPCSCGVAVPSCEFWRAVFEDANLPMNRDFLGQAMRATRILENALPRPGRYRGELARLYTAVWPVLLEAVARQSGASIIVDSSKTTRWTRCRPRALRESGIAMSVVHLTRDPQQVIAAALRGTNEELARGGSAGPGLLTPLRVAVSWIAANRFRSPVAKPPLHVAYEDLLSEGESALEELLKLLELDAGPIHPFLYGLEPLPAGHGIAGNRFRQTGDIYFRRSAGSATPSLPAHARGAVALTRPTARAFGYGVER